MNRSLVLIAAVALVYARTLGYGFLEWDDRLHLLENPDLTPPSWSGLFRVWTHAYGGLYIPVPYFAWGLARLLFGASAVWSIHLLSVGVHAFNAWLVYQVLELLLRPGKPAKKENGRYSEMAAGFGALFFAVHPLQVESVAWISNLRDLLSACFALLAVREHLRGRASPYRRNLYYLLALLCKPTALVVPLLYAAIDYLKNRMPLAPSMRSLAWVLAGLPLMWIAKANQADAKIDTLVEWYLRPLVALDTLGFYGWKTWVPWDLIQDYGRTPRRVVEGGAIYWTWTIPLAVLGAWIWWGGWRQRLAVCLAIFPLLPYLGLIPFVYQVHSTVSDHYFYLSAVGVSLALADLGLRIAQTRSAREAWFGGGGILVGLTVLSCLQVGFWKSDEALFTRTLEVNPRSYLAETQLGRILYEQGQYAEARVHLRKAYDLTTGYSPTIVLLGMSEIQNGEPARAVELFTRYLKLNPVDVNAVLNLAVALLKLGRVVEAADQARKALALMPQSPAVKNVLGIALEFQGQLSEAKRYLEEAVSADPSHPEYRQNLQRVLSKLR